MKIKIEIELEDTGDAETLGLLYKLCKKSDFECNMAITEWLHKKLELVLASVIKEKQKEE